MGYGIFGYVEVQDAESANWSVYKELETGDIGRGGPAQLVFGYGSKTTDCVSLFKDRGLPADVTEEVRKEYMERQVHRGPRGEYRDMFGHSHVYARELPQFVLDRLGPLADAAEEHDSARLLVWFNR